MCLTVLRARLYVAVVSLPGSCRPPMGSCLCRSQQSLKLQCCSSKTAGTADAAFLLHKALQARRSSLPLFWPYDELFLDTCSSWKTAAVNNTTCVSLAKLSQIALDGLYVREGFASVNFAKAASSEEGRDSGSSHHLIQWDRASTEGSYRNSVHPEHELSVSFFTDQWTVDTCVSNVSNVDMCPLLLSKEQVAEDFMSFWTLITCVDKNLVFVRGHDGHAWLC